MSILQSLKIEPLVFLMQIGLFLLLWGFMSQMFWKPMLQHLDSRDQNIKDAYKTVEQTRHEMEALRADYQTRITKIEADARAHIQQAIKEAQTERERIIAEARAHAEATIRQGAADLEREKAESLASLGGWMTNLAQTAVGKTLGQTADPTALRSSLEASIVRRQGASSDPARN